MKGTVKAYSPIINAGVIQSDLGKVYIFRAHEWKNDALPVIDQPVRFEAQDRKAFQVQAESKE